MERPEARPNILAVEHETNSSATRTTVSGRTLTYHLRVLQQPVRARACGQGAKSSADRRPVDPPPIVELKIMDGETDVTFAIRANYFLFATLEHARPMAHGRVNPERTSPPVLTGTPVAGMVYLDRPQPAGYFIFPDLSVRHEGKYRLSFSLYEEIKDLGDADKPPDGAPLNAANESHVTHRLEVRSEPFTVFSAKKFPGLTESTSLSRTVAEQGCRVRIRRDVRMRRRDTKGGGKDWDDYEDDTTQARARMSVTPETNGYSTFPGPHGYMDPIARPRSASNTSHQSLVAPSSLSRRPSLQDMNQAFNPPQFAKPPHTPQNGYPQSTPYGPAAAHPYPQPYMHQPTSMQPPPPQFPAPHYHTSPSSGPAPGPPHPGYYNYPPPPAHSHPPPPPYNVPHQPPYDHAPSPHPNPDYPPPAQPYDHRRPSNVAAVSSSAPFPPGSYSGVPTQPQYQHQATSRPAPVEPKTQSTAAASRSSLELPPLNTALNTTLASSRVEACSPASALPPSNPYQTAISTPVESHKRSYGSVFKDRAQNQSLRHGARPDTAYGGPHVPVGDDHDDDDPDATHADFESLGKSNLRYRRADGRQIRRALPIDGMSL